MMIVDDIKFAIGVSLAPGQKATTSLGVVGALKLYYKVMLLPMLLSILLQALLNGLFLLPTSLGVRGTAGITFVSVAIVFAIYVIINPIILLLYAGVMHVIGRVLNLFQGGGYGVTFSANVYGALPGLLLSWIPLVSFLGALWGIVVLILALSNLQKMSKLASFGVWLAATIILVILLVVPAIILGAIFALGLLNPSTGLSGQSCIASATYLCQNATLSGNGTVSFYTGQSSGATYYNVQLACVGSISSSGQPIPSTAFRPVASSMANGQSVSVAGLQCYDQTGLPLASLAHGYTYTGRILINYTAKAGAPGPTNPYLTSSAALVLLHVT